MPDVLLGTASDAADTIGLTMAEVWEAVARGWLRAVCPECGLDVTGPRRDRDLDHADGCSGPAWAIYHPEEP